MSRNEMFLLLAGALAAAIIANGPMPMFHTPPSTMASLFAPPDPAVVVADGATNRGPELPRR